MIVTVLAPPFEEKRWKKEKKRLWLKVSAKASADAVKPFRAAPLFTKNEVVLKLLNSFDIFSTNRLAYFYKTSNAQTHKRTNT
jgi:hypothetical protein